MVIRTIAALIAAALLGATGGAHAEATELRLARQFGIAYLPFLEMEKHQLIEKQAAKLGLAGVKVTYLQLGGGGPMNDSLLSGNLDFAAAGVPVFLSLWNKTQGNIDVRVASGLDNIPVFLNTANPRIRTLRDFGDGDKIALPAVKISLQALILQMAAAREWGPESYTRLDKLTVSMKHPDAMIALLAAKSEVSAHFAAPPYMFQELEHPGVHVVLNSADVLGAHSFNVIYTTARFREQNPRLYKAFLLALDEAMDLINQDKRAAARLYNEMTNGKPDQLALLDKIVADPSVEFTTVPNGLMKFAEFMHRVGSLGRTPESWKGFCFPEAAAKAGS
jgi:NitT/TauT family transport system substrate-binding protein